MAALLLALAGFWSPQARAQPGAPLAAPSEVWRSGITIEKDADYTSTAGRLLTENAWFNSARASQVYFAFPAPATQKTVQAARYYLLARAGSYGGSATLALEVRSLDGALQRTVSAAPVDLAGASLNTWLDLPLSANPADLVVQPGEYLAFHFQLDGGASGDLDVRSLFEVIVE